MIEFFYEKTDFKFEKTDIIRKWIKQTAKEEKKNLGEIAIIFTNDENLLQINKQYLNHDYYTDVITFDYTEENTISGDIFISVDRVRDNSKTYNTTFENELNRVIIHGILHLLGYKDKTDIEQTLMRKKEDHYLQKLNENEK